MEAPDLKQIFGNYTSWKIDSMTWIIQFMNGSQYMYLLEGSEKALLIDTGWGAGNLKQYVQTLTRKPLLVANTHFHPDHAAGNGEFQEVYVSKNYLLDEPSLAGEGPFDLSQLPYPNYKKICVGTGDSIDLGGRSIEIIDALPAHCNSTLFFFDREHGMFFCGDDFESAQVLLYDNSNNPEICLDVRTKLDNFKNNALKIKEAASQIKFLLPNHNGTPIALAYIDEYIALVDHIYAGDAIIEDQLNHPFIEMDPKASYLCRVRWEHSSVFMNKAELMSVYGK